MHMAPLSQTFLELLHCQEHCHTAAASIYPYTCTGEPQDTEDSPVLPQGEEDVPVVQLGRRLFFTRTLGQDVALLLVHPPRARPHKDTSVLPAACTC